MNDMRVGKGGFKLYYSLNLCGVCCVLYGTWLIGEERCQIKYLVGSSVADAKSGLNQCEPEGKFIP
jgi:hypothetical protein